MSTLDPKLNTVKVLIVVAKTERSLLLRQFLKNFHTQLQVVNSVYEATQFSKVNLPYLVFCDTQLSDGSVLDLRQKLNSSGLAKVVIVGLVPPHEKDAEKYRAGGVIPVPFAKLDARQFGLLFAKIFQTMSYRSPFAIDLSSDASCECHVRSDATVMGKLSGQMVIRSQTSVDARAVARCLPLDEKKFACQLNAGVNVPAKDTYYNLFPIRRIQGPGMEWIARIPELNIQGKGKGKSSKLVYVDANIERAQDLLRILRAYQFDVVHLEHWLSVVEHYRSGDLVSGVVYAAEEPESDLQKDWNDLLAALDEQARPNVLYATNTLKHSLLPYQRYILKPFGLGMLLDTVRACFASPEDLQRANASGNADGASISMHYQFPAKMLFLDECGGVIESTFALQPGARIYFAKSSVLNFPEEWRLNVTRVRPSPHAKIWHIRFDIQQSGMNSDKLLGYFTTQLGAKAS